MNSLLSPRLLPLRRDDRAASFLFYFAEQRRLREGEEDAPELDCEVAFEPPRGADDVAVGADLG